MRAIKLSLLKNFYYHSGGKGYINQDLGYVADLAQPGYAVEARALPRCRLALHKLFYHFPMAAFVGAYAA